DAACDVVPWTHRLFQHREFRARYAPMSFRGLVPFQAEGTVWVRKNSPVALETTESTLTVKAPLLARSGGVALLDEKGLVVEVPPGRELRVDRIGSFTRVVDVDAEPAIVARIAGHDVLSLRNRGSVPARVRSVVLARRDAAKW
ncbi:MAG TPA: hypothetical protein VGK73_06015, partial [Polyangiaceae bacterium]